MKKKIIKKLKKYDVRVVLRDNWKDVKRIVKWGVTGLVAYSFGTQEPLGGALTGLVTKVVLDFIDYLISSNTEDTQPVKEKK